MAVTGEAPVATRYTLEFVERSFPAGATDVLEVGCGAGELAQALSERMRVVAVDDDPACVAAARDRGIDARTMSWPAEIDGEFDAILFTRSLHHIHDLDGAIAAAVTALRPGGRIIVEDFCAEGSSERSRVWSAGLIELLAAAGTFRSGDVAKGLLDKIGPSDPHGHELHSSQVIARALERYGPVERETAAYYFRYLEPELPRTATEMLLRHELDLIGARAIDALGLRYVLSPRE